MISCQMEKLTPSARKLVRDRVASRIHAKDDSLFAFDKEAQECASRFMGWADIASTPVCDVNAIVEFARQAHEDGLDTVVLIGQGGSSQAPMTITKYNQIDSDAVTFRTIDSDSPVRVRELMAVAKPARTLYIVASKSGGTIETRTMLRVLRKCIIKKMPAKDVPAHLVAITDPGSPLEQQALKEGWRGVFNGEPSVGGRYSAMSVFGLLPAALAGIDIKAALKHAAQAEAICAEDAIDNPAIGLAAFLYDNYRKGRDKFCFLTPKRGRVLGLWIEQLVAESLGKRGKGILPNIEVDSLILSQPRKDRCAIMYTTKNDLWDERKNFEMSLAYVDPTIPTLRYRITSVMEVAEHFVMWEYAIAMCGYLMKVCPFDQPDVTVAKEAVLDMLHNGLPEPDFIEEFTEEVTMGEVEVRCSQALPQAQTLKEAIGSLLRSIEPGDYFSLNAFLPFTGEYRREALEEIRHGVAAILGVVSCIEVGPRYLHSTGQLHKGGPNTGVFLVLSAGELKDITTDKETQSLGVLAKTQAVGDWSTLSDRGRRCVHVHLPDNSGVTLRALCQIVRDTLLEIKDERR